MPVVGVAVAVLVVGVTVAVAVVGVAVSVSVVTIGVVGAVTSLGVRSSHEMRPLLFASESTSAVLVISSVFFTPLLGAKRTLPLTEGAVSRPLPSTLRAA